MHIYRLPSDVLRLIFEKSANPADLRKTCRRFRDIVNKQLQEFCEQLERLNEGSKSKAHIVQRFVLIVRVISRKYPELRTYKSYNLAEAYRYVPTLGHIVETIQTVQKSNRTAILSGINGNTLVASNLGIRILTRAIQKFHQLTSINLSHNKIASLPDAISELSQLMVLNLRQNLLKELPNSMCKLAKITHLDLSDNLFTTLPIFIARYPKLESLLIRNLRIHFLPRAFDKFAIRPLQEGQEEVDRYISHPKLTAKNKNGPTQRDYSWSITNQSAMDNLEPFVGQLDVSFVVLQPPILYRSYLSSGFSA